MHSSSLYYPTPEKRRSRFWSGLMSKLFFTIYGVFKKILTLLSTLKTTRLVTKNKAHIVRKHSGVSPSAALEDTWDRKWTRSHRLTRSYFPKLRRGLAGKQVLHEMTYPLILGPTSRTAFGNGQRIFYLNNCTCLASRWKGGWSRTPLL